MAGPNIQIPSFPVTDTPDWAAYLSALGQMAQAMSQNGTSGARPSSTLLPISWIGMPFFDNTLGQPIFLKSVNPDVWVDATGSPV